MLLIEAIPWKTFLVSLVAGLARNLFGWWENACDEKSRGGKEITRYEKAELGATLIRVVILTFSIYLPLNALGITGAELAAGGSAIVFDFLLKAWKKPKKMIIEEPK